MANKKITALTAITALDVADVLPVADVSIPETKKITAANLWLGGFNAHKDIDGTFAANSDLVFPTQKAAKTYVDTAVAAKISELGVSAFVKTLLDDTSAKAARATLDAMPAGAYELTDGATIAIDWDNGATQYVVLGATGRTVTFANPVNGAVYRFIIIQDGSGSQTITTWPTIKWAGGSAPTLTTTAGKADIITLLYANSAYYADCAYNF